MTTKVYCDLCGKEIHQKLNYSGSFRDADGLLVEVQIKCAEHSADLCKECVIDIIQNGETVGWGERVYERPEKVPDTHS